MLVGHKLYKNVMGGREGLEFDALALHVSSIDVSFTSHIMVPQKST